MICPLVVLLSHAVRSPLIPVLVHRRTQSSRRRPGRRTRTRDAGHLVILTVTEIAALVASGCASPRGEHERFPPLEDTIAVIETIPAQGATDFDPRGQIDFCFSNYLDPAGISELDAALYSGRIRFDSELDTQLFAWRPLAALPVERSEQEPLTFEEVRDQMRYGLLADRGDAALADVLAKLREGVEVKIEQPESPEAASL